MSPNGKRKSLGVFDTKADAEAALEDAKVKRRNGVEPFPSTLTVEEVIDGYLKHGTHEVTVTTLNRYRELWRLHAKATLGALRVGKLRKAHVTALYGKLGETLKGRTVLKLHRVLHHAFRWALEQEVLAANPFASIAAPKAMPTEARALAQHEANRFFAAAKGHALEDYLQIAVMTGARRGELAALRWSNVDLSAKQMAIREARTCTREKKADRKRSGAAAEVTKAPKSRQTRIVPLDDASVAVFKRIRARQAEFKLRGDYEDRGYVFAGSSGEPVPLNSLTKAFREIADGADIDKGLSLHSLRHTAATWALASGADILAVQQILGHAAASTTLNVYGHAVAEAKTRAAGLVATALQVAIAGDSST